jgi:apolipoprotein D and lipocalin family protein
MLTVVSAMIFSLLNSAATAAVPLVPSYNTTAYLGTWYQIADIKEPYEILCSACTRAIYGLNDNGTVAVHNECNYLKPDGPTGGIYGYAIPDAAQPAKLSVCFFGNCPSIPNYWIMQLGPLNKDGLYSYALVGNWDRLSLYILNREPTMDNTTLTNAITWIREEAGYNVDRLSMTLQEGCKYQL